MSAELSKAFDAAAVQAEVQATWDAEKPYHAEPTDPGEPYSIVIPPPNVTAALHLGHALNNTIQDILVRHARMQGKNAVWLPGTDHAGIATQTVVEKRVMKDEGKRRTDFSREAFVEKIQAWKDEYEKVILGQLKAMGCSCDWERTAFTMDEPRAKAVREAFFQLFKAGLIYRGKRLVNWDPVTQTALADDEVEMEEVDGNFYYLRYPLCNAEGGMLNAESDPALSSFLVPHSSFAAITVATTRPETMLGDSAVAINPTDPRAAALRGKFVKLPIVSRVIPIIEDDYVVKPVQFGGDPNDTKAQMATGFLKVTPAHDPNDYDIGRRHNLPVINVMAPDASISDKHGWTDVGDAGFVIGKSREEARKLIVKWFKEKGLLEEIKPYRHSVGHSYRSHVPIEPYLSDQWYCRVTDPRLAGRANEVITPSQRGTGFQPVSAAEQPNPASPDHGLKTHATKDAGLTFYPARYAKTYQTWHENIRDWCISRQLWWGHRIPVWSRPKWDGEDYSEQAVENYFRQFVVLPACGNDAAKASAAMESIAFNYTETHLHVCLRGSESDAAIIEMMTSKMGYTQDPDVLDTWFSSGLWPLSTLGWPDRQAIEDPNSALNRWNPTDVLCTAREIITLWVSRMVMFNEFFRDPAIESRLIDGKSPIANRKSALPFKDVFVHAMIQDGHGQKMSKSLGNGVDPLDIIHTHGADAMRFTLTSMTTHTQDVRMPVDSIDPHTGETFTPAFVTDSAGYKVAAPVQEHKGKKFVSTYGLASGQATPTKEMPLARNTSSKFDLGRNFANKLWNAARFVLSQINTAGEPAGAQGGAGSSLTLIDRWILSRLTQTIHEIDAALGEYRFDQYAKSCYDFFWRDFCDWYVEAAKPQMRDPSRAGTTKQVLAAVLDASLRLLHPITPFITERLWWSLNDTAEQRGIDGWTTPNSPDASNTPPRITRAAWPKPTQVDQQAIDDFAQVQALITAIRTARNDYKIEPRRQIDLSIKADEKIARQVESLRETVETLATCKLSAIGPQVAAPADATTITLAGVEIYAEGLVDKAAEAERKTKRRGELEKSIAAKKARLANAGYVAKAPAKLVKETQDQLAAEEAELAALG